MDRGHCAKNFEPIRKEDFTDAGPLRHFCASAFIYDIAEEKFLLIRHRKCGYWIPPGGHVEADERPDVTAVREAQEETGIAVRLVGAPAPLFPGETAIVQPFGLRIYEDGPGHEHMSFLYAAVPTGGSLAMSEREVEDVGWFSLDKIFSESFGAAPAVGGWCRFLSKKIPSLLPVEN
ncbi:MAG: NUDIX domain-containing protein [Puniceicoccales bacterium]|nr:NUDIX domain-containing protein [Puniceicoccales bacterium]